MPSRRPPVLGPAAIRAIEGAVDEVFDRAKARVLGPASVSKRLYTGWNPHFSLPGIFETASREEGVVPNLHTLNQILKVAGGYIDSTRERTKARVIKAVQSFLLDAHQKGQRTDPKIVLGGQLADVWSDAVTKMRQIVESEANTTKNVGILEGITRINAASGINDPTVYFVVVRDRVLCDECIRLHMMPDERTPRLWKLSEVGNGYHKKGENNPKMNGLHPHCRCQLATLMPGYGFSGKGFVTFISPGYDAYAEQRK